MATTAAAQETNTQSQVDDFRVEARLNDKTTIIVNQPVVVRVEILSKSKFPTRVEIINPAVKDIVYLPNKSVGINGTKNIDGVSWISQLHEVILYPTQGGQYILPSFEVRATLKGDNESSISKNIRTKEVAFEVNIPEPLADISDFITSKKVTFEVINLYKNESKEDLSTVEFEVGEAITRIIRINANGVPAMMFPSLDIIAMDGLGVYQKPPLLDDKYNRGQLLGSREETLTYIFEKAGVYALPEQRIYWWNLSDNALEMFIIPAEQWQVSGSNAAVITESTGEFSFIQLVKSNVYWLVSVLFFLIVLRLVYRHRTTLLNFYDRLTKRAHRHQLKACKSAILDKNYELACQLLYQIHGIPVDNITTLKALYKDSPDKLDILNKLLAKAYSKSGVEEDIKMQDINVLFKRVTLKAVTSDNDCLILNRR